MPALSPFGIVLFALQAAVGYAAYRSLKGASTAAVVVGVCVTLLGIGVLFEAGLIAVFVVDLAALALAAVARTQVDAGPART